MNFIKKIEIFLGFHDNSKIKLMKLCLLVNGLVLSIFIPWSRIFKSNAVTETIVGLLCVFLIGLLILFVFEWMLILAYLVSFPLLVLFIIKNWRIKRAKIFFVVFIGITLFSFLNFKEVQELFTAAFTGSWWGDCAYFAKGF